MSDFARQLLHWRQGHGRHDLPWQQHVSAYRVWVSEIMLQQTQVSTVIPYYRRFMQVFPDVHALAGAALDEVLHLWTGLGYYARGRNLHKAAKTICTDFAGEFPANMTALMSLPGIGRSTAAAILCLSHNQAHPILDGNVKRVLSRYHLIRGWPGESRVEKRLWALAESHVPIRQAGAYTQAIMDLGALVCTRLRPHCALCPVAAGCGARKQGLEHDLPHKKPKKIRPTKQTIFALIENQIGEILLQKRPPVGIWGGLWGFPECPSEQNIVIWIRDHYGLATNTVSQGPHLRHTFSHFHLDIQPIKLKLAAGEVLAREAHDLCWYTPGREINLGMAAPVKKLIDRLCRPLQ